MNWAAILKKNDKDFDNKCIKLDKKDDLEIDNYKSKYIDSNIKDINNEFDNMYSIKIMDLKYDFKEYINELALPFLDGTNKNSFYNFIKNNCSNYKKLEKEINSTNDEYINEIQDQNDDIFYDNKANKFNSS